MKHFITILSTIILLSLMSCEKTLTIQFGDDAQNIETVEFTNTVTLNGETYTLSDLSIYVEENGTDFIDDIAYITEPVFVIEGEARRLTGTTSMDGSTASNYDIVSFFTVIPTTNYGKTYNLKDKKTYGGIAFGFGKVIELRNGYGLAQTTTDTKGSLYFSTQDGDTSRSFTDSEDYLTNASSPKKANYYIDIENTYKKFYKVYIQYEDANGDKYALSYKGDDEL